MLYQNKELRFEIFKGLDENEYTFRCQHIENPQAFKMLQDFVPYYQEWLYETFPLSKPHADALAAGFPDFFADALLEQLQSKPKQYATLLGWCNSPELAKWATVVKRKHYQAELKERYFRPALGQEDVSLSDVYVELDFRVYDRILSEERQQELREKHEIDSSEHFLPTGYQGSIHDYFKTIFIQENKTSEAIASAQEDKRLLLLLGQPGHGKSSFCYRCIHDLKNDPTFLGNVFFVRLEEAQRDILNHPKMDVQRLLKKDSITDFQAWIDPSHQQKNVVFLDGLDEFYMTQGLDDGEVLRFLDNCRNWLIENPYLYIIITSRFNYVETSKLHNGERLLLALGELQQEQQLNLIEQFKARKSITACNLDEDLLEKMEEEDAFPSVKELIKLPILLQMVLISGVPLDEARSKAAIYSELFDTVIKRKWDKPLRKQDQSKKYETKHLRNYLGYLAFKIYQNQEGYVRRSDIEGEETERFIRKFLKIDYQEEHLKAALKDVLTSFYLKRTPEGRDGS